MSKCSNVQTLLIVTTNGNNSRCHRYFHLIGQVSPQEAIKKLYNCHLLPLDLDFVPFPPATTLTTSSLLLLLFHMSLPFPASVPGTTLIVSSCSAIRIDWTVSESIMILLVNYNCSLISAQYVLSDCRLPKYSRYDKLSDQ